MKYTEDVIKEFCQENGLTFNGIVSKQGTNQLIRKVDVTCHCGHRYDIMPTMLIKSKVSCNKCKYIKVRTTSASDIQQLAEDRGYTYVKEVSLNRRRFIDLVCPSKHEVTLRVDHFVSGSGCGYCKKNVKHSYEFVRQTIESEDGYTLLSTEYINEHTPLLVECPKGHTCQPNLSNWVKGNRCSTCSGANFTLAPASVYYVRFDTKLGPMYKIGITSHKNAEDRFYRENIPFRVLSESRYMSREFALLEERSILNKYEKFRYKGEPLLLSGSTELFTKDVLNLDV
ncbi:MAG: hypothetical protein KME47_09905 [Nodosilinea sp. WJT8-NPBG4]|jgi:hypothetical protein|nr:hypothetical protein [Nodosilinea sp. WJT8-NPBG4]